MTDRNGSFARGGTVALIAATLALAMTAGCVALRPVAASEITRSDEGACFSATGFCVRDAFRARWEANGGPALNGYPLTAERIETLEDGLPYIVQYFERVRMEYHPENTAPSDVLLGQFGRRILAERAGRESDPPTGPSGDGTFYPETEHNIIGAFLAYWRGHGGLTQFGYPLTESFRERLEDEGTYTV